MVVKEVQLRLPIDPATFDAGPADRIEMQLMYCPHGWANALRRYQTMELLAMAQNEGDGMPAPILSPRIAVSGR